MRTVHLALLALIAASPLDAQDTTATMQRVWVSGGVGCAPSPGTLAGLIAGWYSRSAFAIGVRAGGAAAIFGEHRGDRSLLIGATTRGARDFLVAGLGLGQVTSGYSTSDSRHTNATAVAVVYGVESHPKSSFGLGATLFGALGTPMTRYTAVAVTINAVGSREYP